MIFFPSSSRMRRALERYDAAVNGRRGPTLAMIFLPSSSRMRRALERYDAPANAMAVAPHSP